MSEKLRRVRVAVVEDDREKVLKELEESWTFKASCKESAPSAAERAAVVLSERARCTSAQDAVTFACAEIARRDAVCAPELLAELAAAGKPGARAEVRKLIAEIFNADDKLCSIKRTVDDLNRQVASMSRFSACTDKLSDFGVKDGRFATLVVAGEDPMPEFDDDIQIKDYGSGVYSVSGPAEKQEDAEYALSNACFGFAEGDAFKTPAEVIEEEVEVLDGLYEKEDKALDKLAAYADKLAAVVAYMSTLTNADAVPVVVLEGKITEKDAEEFVDPEGTVVTII